MLLHLRKSSRSLNYVTKAYFSKLPRYVHSLSASFLLNEDPKPRKRTKTVCTIGYLTSHTAQRPSRPKMQASSSTRA